MNNNHKGGFNGVSKYGDRCNRTCRGLRRDLGDSLSDRGARALNGCRRLSVRLGSTTGSNYQLFFRRWDSSQSQESQ